MLASVRSIILCSASVFALYWSQQCQHLILLPSNQPKNSQKFLSILSAAICNQQCQPTAAPHLTIRIIWLSTSACSVAMTDIRTLVVHNRMGPLFGTVFIVGTTSTFTDFSAGRARHLVKFPGTAIAIPGVPPPAAPWLRSRDVFPTTKLCFVGMPIRD
jgi:hypothetical protein